MMMTAPIKAVLFDLDGTLVDTARDFVRIIKQLADDNGWQAPSDAVIRERVSAGSKAIVSLFQQHEGIEQPNHEITEQRIEQLKQQFLDSYEAEICVESQLYVGLEQLLGQLETQGIDWGVVTNKPRYLAEKLIAQLGLAERCSVLVCPDDVTHSKPNPEPMYLAMQRLNISKAEASSVVYIGDHRRDIQAGNAAGNITVIAGFGYITENEKQQFSGWQANYITDTPNDLVALIYKLIQL